MEFRYYIDPETAEPHIYRHNVDEDDVEDVLARPRFATTEEEKVMSGRTFPPGWDEERVRRVLDFYEAQSVAEAVAEDEAAYESTTETMMAVPVELVARVRELIENYRSE